MLANAEVTFYSAKDYSRHTAAKAYWNDSRSRTVTKNGIQATDAVSIYLYTNEYVPNVGDIIVKGIVSFEFNAENKKSLSDSLKLFREQYPSFSVVKAVSDFRYGGLRHIEITAR